MTIGPRNLTSAPLVRAWHHGPIPVIGLIGGIGSGKSQVAALLAERGARVIDADEVGHRVLEQPEVRRLVLDRFGMGVAESPVADDSALPLVNRRKLGAIVFSNPESLRDLEGLLHPRMERQFRLCIEEWSREAHVPVIVLDAAILLETGWDRLCDLVVYVDAPLAVRLTRVQSTRGWTPEILRAREAAQDPLEVKRARADLILSNDAGLDALEHSVDHLLASIARLAVPTPGAEARPTGVAAAGISAPKTSSAEARCAL